MRYPRWVFALITGTVIIILIFLVAIYIAFKPVKTSATVFPENFLKDIATMEKLMENKFPIYKNEMWEMGFNRVNINEKNVKDSYMYKYAIEHPKFVDKFEKTYINGFRQMLMNSVKYNPTLYYNNLKNLKKWESIHIMLSWYMTLRPTKISNVSNIYKHYSTLYFSYMYSYFISNAAQLNYDMNDIYPSSLSLQLKYILPSPVNNEIIQKHKENLAEFNKYREYLDNYINPTFLNHLEQLTVPKPIEPFYPLAERAL